MPTKSISRAQLHALVWARPMRDVAADFRISDVGLKKICVKHNIPTPPQGYWQRAHPHGPPAAPELKGGRAAQVIDIQLGEEPVQLPAEEEARMNELLAFEADPANHPSVGSTDAELHPLARRVDKELRAASPDADWGCVRFAASGISLRVSPSGVPRAVRILDALLKGFELRGFLLSKQARAQSIDELIEIEGEFFSFSIDEVSRRVEHVLTPDDVKEREARKRMSWDEIVKYRSNEPQWDFRPSNQFTIKRGYSTIVARDTARTAVEDRLWEVPSILIRAAFDRRQEAREDNKRREHLARLEFRKDQQRHLRELESEAAERLSSFARRWEKAQAVRRFIAAAEQAEAPADLADKRRRWLEWANRQADHLDPMSGLAALFGDDLDAIAELRLSLSEDVDQSPVGEP